MNININSDFWNDKYTSGSTGWDIGEVSEPLKQYIDQLNDKGIAILIPGAGNAYEAEYLHNKGFKNITVIDLSEYPIANLRKRCPDFPEEKLLNKDFFDHKGAYDLIIEQTFFCALNPSLRSNYFEKMYELLNPKGGLLGCFLIFH